VRRGDDARTPRDETRREAVRRGAHASARRAATRAHLRVVPARSPRYRPRVAQLLHPVHVLRALHVEHAETLVRDGGVDERDARPRRERDGPVLVGGARDAQRAQGVVGDVRPEEVERERDACGGSRGRVSARARRRADVDRGVDGRTDGWTRGDGRRRRVGGKSRSNLVRGARGFSAPLKMNPTNPYASVGEAPCEDAWGCSDAGGDVATAADRPILARARECRSWSRR